MVSRPHVERGQIWLVELDPAVGREIQKTRPCLIVSPDAMNRHLRTYTVVPLTSGSRAAPFRVLIQFRGKEGFLLPEQLRTVDRSRLKTCWGDLDPQTLARTLKVLREMFEE